MSKRKPNRCHILSMVFTPIHHAFLQTDATLSQELTSWEKGLHDTYQAWKNSIASMEQLLLNYCQSVSLTTTEPSHPAISPVQGLILSGPTPVLYHPTLSIHFQSCLWIPSHWNQPKTQLLPCANTVQNPHLQAENVIPILDNDPLGLEQFCVVLTRDFGWVSTLSHHPDATPPFFAISFNPETVAAVTNILSARVEQQRPHQAAQFKKWIQGFPSPQPDYNWPMQFSRQILAQSARFESPSQIVNLEPKAPLAHPPIDAIKSPSLSDSPTPTLRASENERSSAINEKEHDIELLKAIAHEIRTPLATIQTLTRLLMRRKDLPDDVIKRLEAIQQECTHQIDRFSLIFRAIELTTTPSASLQHSLTTMSLQQLFNQRMPRWESILERRSLEFDVELPQDLPAIAIRDPNMLDQVLTGLIEQLSHTLPLGSQMSLKVTLAGEQLKLQLKSSLPEDDASHQSNKSMLKAVGQLLMLQPETGNLSLSLPATKEIFNFLGGKLTVRQSPPRGEILTMFLPLDAFGSALL